MDGFGAALERAFVTALLIALAVGVVAALALERVVLWLVAHVRLGWASLVLVAVLAAPVGAEPTPLRLPHGATIAARATDVAVGVPLALALRDAWRSPDRRHALSCVAAETAVTMGVTELVKRLVHRERPDHSDRLSFPSGHTALAAANAHGLGWTIVANVAIGRQMAGKHFLTDTLGGFAIGAAAGRICR